MLDRDRLLPEPARVVIITPPAFKPIEVLALIKPSDLATPLRVHRSVYTDPVIFQAERERIFGRAWLYAGHESRIPEPGDWITTRLGLEEMILIRGQDRSINLLVNRCPHRGTRLLSGERGNSAQIVCPYHAWSFSADGSLSGLPLREGYGESFRLDDPARGIARAPRVESYRGFIFASHAATGPGLKEFLGGIATAIDNLVDRAPAGRVSQTVAT